LKSQYYTKYIYFFSLYYTSNNMVLNFVYEVYLSCSTHSFSNYWLCSKYMSGRVLGSWDSAVNQIFLEGTLPIDRYMRS
jgi:hypothetical protein